MSTDSTSIAAPAVAAVVLCLWASPQRSTIMFSFIPRTLLLPGPQFLFIWLFFSRSFFFLFVLSCTVCLSLTLSVSPPSFSFEFLSAKLWACQSFPWWLKLDVGVLKCSKWNNLEVVTFRSTYYLQGIPLGCSKTNCMLGSFPLKMLYIVSKWK